MQVAPHQVCRFHCMVFKVSHYSASLQLTTVAARHDPFVATGASPICANVNGSRTALKPSCLMRQTMVRKSLVTLSVPNVRSPGKVSPVLKPNLE